MLSKSVSIYVETKYRDYVFDAFNFSTIYRSYITDSIMVLIRLSTSLGQRERWSSSEKFPEQKFENPCRHIRSLKQSTQTSHAAFGASAAFLPLQ